MWLYTGLCISISIWIVLGIYVFSEIKKTYDRGGVFTDKLLNIWFVMWAFHHVAVILSSLYGVWLIPVNRTLALISGLFTFVFGTVILSAGMIGFRSLQRSYGQDTSRLVTSGIYRWSRNPQFIGWALMLSGISLAGRSGFAFVLTGVFTIVIHLYTTRMEEPYLERLYGEEYRQYKLSTPRYIGIPKK
ncbi:MAG: isoprenylcysteine carboxylmethyltransferase family protein [Nitrospirae bacterium]|nr:isoprenylcysteine carboxylmethyltransferase family protein [Nitrospirota bacterium]